jgi:hypothetical protein
MPLDLSILPEEVQTAFFIFDFLEDVWEGMSGTYLGKNWSTTEYFFNLYEVDQPKIVLQFMKLYERLLIIYRHEKSDRKRKAEERKAKASSGGGKSYTHSVKR